MPSIGFKLPRNSVFFYTKDIESAEEKAEKKVLGRFGFYVRRDSRRSMRKKKKPSKKGKPPRVVTGLLKNFIFYSYEKFKQSVVIGAAKLAGFKGAGVAPGRLESKSDLDRQFMDPAFQRQLAQHMPDMWKDSIK